jgi:hypothetical protein
MWGAFAVLAVTKIRFERQTRRHARYVACRENRTGVLIKYVSIPSPASCGPEFGPSGSEFSLPKNRLILLAPRAGFEPATNRLTAGCSTTELPGNKPVLRRRGYNKA